MTITIYGWMIPLVITIISLICPFVYKPAGDYDIFPFIILLLAVIVSLVSWLIYFIIV